MNHLDLFSGIGGFALAADRVFGNVEHTFVEIDPFCQKVLTKHWPESTIYGDIRTVTPNTKHSGESRSQATGEDRGTQSEGQTGQELSQPEPQRAGGLRSQEAGRIAIDLLTGGFPCQPFSQAGKRKGTDDNRYLWPEMLRVIREFEPTWVIAENVRGLLTWNDGLVFEQVCADLESQGYEVQPFIVPACSVNAPHRRDRIWFVAHTENTDGGRKLRNVSSEDEAKPRPQEQHQDQAWQFENAGWYAEWTEVAAELCRVDDGISPGLDEFAGYTKARHRQERLKALGNAIVPQVAEQIMRGMIQ